MDQQTRIPMPAPRGRGAFQRIGGKKLRNDILFITALLLTVAALGLVLFLFREEGRAVTVEVDGQVVGTYPLSVDRVVDIPTGEGEMNRLVIREGQAFMQEATCPDGLCVSHKPISHTGESIVCLPHRVVVTVTGDGDEGPDVVA